LNKKFLTTGLTFSILGFIAKVPYRKFIYENNIFDFGLSDSLPSFLYIIGIIFIFLYFNGGENRKRVFMTIIIMTAGALPYEFEQYFSNMIFDIKDVSATILGGSAALILYMYISKGHQSKKSLE
jgi:glycopeptide antibiotics resistance protein